MSSSQRPQEKSCFSLCLSCFRCEKKGTNACPAAYSCSGHIETDEGHDWDKYDRDDECRCKEGIMQVRLKSGNLVRRKFLSSPFESTVKTDAISQDESDWNAYLQEKREFLGDESFDPLQFEDGSGSVSDWVNNSRGGM